MKHAFLAYVTVSTLALLFAACGGTPASDPVKGEELFNTGGASMVPCANCHTLDGTYRIGPSLEGIASRADSRVEGMSAEDYLRESITDPSAHIVEGFTDTMYKDYGKDLGEQDISNLIAFLLQQK